MLKSRTITCDDAEFEVLARDVLDQGLTLRFRARGISMHPWVRDGDLVLVLAVPPGHLGPGDIVLFVRDRGAAVVHRVLKRRQAAQGQTFLIKGDRVAHTDGWVPAGQVLGRVIALERRGRAIALDTRGQRNLARVLAWASPFLHRLYPAAERLKAGATTLFRGRAPR